MAVHSPWGYRPPRRGEHHPVGRVDGVHHQVRGSRRSGHPDRDDGPHTDVAQDGVEVGAAHWPRPCQRRSTRSVGSGTELGNSSAPELPAMDRWRRWRTASRCDWNPGCRRGAAPNSAPRGQLAARATGSSRRWQDFAARPSARACSPASGPTTAPCSSWVTIAVWRDRRAGGSFTEPAPPTWQRVVLCTVTRP